jgi:hypothetical protein
MHFFRLKKTPEKKKPFIVSIEGNIGMEQNLASVKITWEPKINPKLKSSLTFR